MTYYVALLINVLILRAVHPFHASVCEIEFNQQTGSLEVSYRMFLDDLEDALKTHSGATLDIVDPSQKQIVDERLENYLSEKLKIWVNESAKNYHYLGSEIENGALWCYVEVTDVKDLKTVAVENRVMLELFDDQVNLVHFNKNDKVRSLKLEEGNTYGVLDIADLFKD